MKHIFRENEDVIREAENLYMSKKYDEVVAFNFILDNIYRETN